MRFRYPLQKIVDLKGNEKSMAEWEFAAALGRLKEDEDRLGDLFNERNSVEARLSETAALPVTLAELTSLQNYLDTIEAKIRQQMRAVELAEDQVRMRQGKLAEKSVDEKVWLNARDRAFQVHRSAWLVKQQNELDEIATVRAAASRG